MTGQIALPLLPGTQGPARIVLGQGNAHIAEALAAPQAWPFGCAVLTGPPRSGKSLFARWFAASGSGTALDDAHRRDETEVFHAWNRAREAGAPLLIIGGTPPWHIALPDLASRLGAALQLEIGPPDDEQAGELLLSLAAERGLPLGPQACAYLLPRAPRDGAGLERLVAAIDRISLERKTAPTLAIWRAALEEIVGPEEPRLL